MLSRNAERMYRLGRYVEHAENVARIVNVNHRINLEQKYFSDIDVWSPMISATRTEKLFGELYSEANEANVCEFLLLSEDNPDSVVSCLRAAREQARTMRDRISEEMWTHLNRMYLAFQNPPTVAQVLAEGSDAFNERILLFCNTFHGLADNTMVRTTSWNFLRLGRFFQRALMTLRTVEVKTHILLPETQESEIALDLYQWEGLLRSVSGYEAYRRLFRARIIPAQVVDLLVANERFPRSLSYCLSQIRSALETLGHTAAAHRELNDAVDAFLGEIQVGFIGRQILQDGLKSEIINLQHRILSIDALLNRTYFDLQTVYSEDGMMRTIAMQQPQQQQMRVSHA
jgi:uncharacterized alpha-E superfamily protein